MILGLGGTAIKDLAEIPGIKTGNKQETRVYASNMADSSRACSIDKQFTATRPLPIVARHQTTVRCVFQLCSCG